jgi:PPOX class probable F420-dependent enzyme
LNERRVVVCATNGPQGWPHLMPLWYVMRGEEIWAWTYAKSQKVKNLERDPRTTLQVEDGELYHELRGVMIEARTTIHRDIETVAGVGTEVLGRFGGGAGAEEIVRAQAAKRVGLQFTPEKIASWDHRKLGGAY